MALARFFSRLMLAEGVPPQLLFQTQFPWLRLDSAWMRPEPNNSFKPMRLRGDSTQTLGEMYR